MLQSIAWFLLAAVHLVPAIALFRPSILIRLYGVKPDHPLSLLMQHRAALFLAVLVACVVSAVDPGGRQLASVITAISMVSFLLLWWRAGAPEVLRTIALVDLAGLPALGIATLGAFGGLRP